ncbi:MBL fold metallo-hydrolase [Metabacillus idriensis]|uniref:MBL fold metallo-hydrolase n=1 Tax=Metabacillus idriensis TaxID=324768 RepID=UPI003D2D56A7
MKTKSDMIIKLTLPTPFPVGDVNVYLVKGDRLTLIDAGPKTPEALAALKTQMEQAGYRVEDIEQVILTHHHPDHVGLLDYLPQSADVIGHPYNAPWIMQDESFMTAQKEFFMKLFTEFGIDERLLPGLAKFDASMKYACKRNLTSCLREGDAVPGMEGWHVIETPGHAQTHIALYRAEDGLMAGGDHLLQHISANPLLEPPMDGGERPRPQVQFNESFHSLLKIPISSVLSGHGETVLKPHDLIRYRLKKQEERAFEVRGYIKEKPMTAFEACQRLFPHLYKRQMMLTMSETVGQLDYLEALGEIKGHMEGAKKIYSC